MDQIDKLMNLDMIENTENIMNKYKEDISESLVVYKLFVMYKLMAVIYDGKSFSDQEQIIEFPLINKYIHDIYKYLGSHFIITEKNINDGKLSLKIKYRNIDVDKLDINDFAKKMKSSYDVVYEILP